jgi:hypothetical protein
VASLVRKTDCLFLISCTCSAMKVGLFQSSDATGHYEGGTRECCAALTHCLSSVHECTHQASRLHALHAVGDAQLRQARISGGREEADTHILALATTSIADNQGTARVVVHLRRKIQAEVRSADKKTPKSDKKDLSPVRPVVDAQYRGPPTSRHDQKPARMTWVHQPCMP